MVDFVPIWKKCNKYFHTVCVDFVVIFLHLTNLWNHKVKGEDQIYVLKGYIKILHALTLLFTILDTFVKNTGHLYALRIINLRRFISTEKGKVRTEGCSMKANKNFLVCWSVKFLLGEICEWMLTSREMRSASLRCWRDSSWRYVCDSYLFFSQKIMD